jgi:hypothetical protein
MTSALEWIPDQVRDDGGGEPNVKTVAKGNVTRKTPKK